MISSIVNIEFEVLWDLQIEMSSISGYAVKCSKEMWATG